MAETFAEELERVWGSWCPTMTPDAGSVAFVSDRDGVPSLWVGPVGGPPRRIHLSDDPVVDVQWSADRAWLSVCVATDGGVRTQVWVVRPDGSDARRVAGSSGVHAELGPWARSGHRLVVTIPSAEPDQPTQALLVDPIDGARQPLASGGLIHVLDLSVEERFVVLLDGRRGEQVCSVVDRMTDEALPLLPDRGTGSTEVAMIRPSPPDEAGPMTVYLVTDMGAPRRELVALAIGPNHWRGPERVVAARQDAELESVDADDSGRLLALTWNVAGSSEVELLDTVTGVRTVVPDLPGRVVEGLVLSRDGSRVICCVDGPTEPRRLWQLETADLRWRPVSAAPRLPDRRLVEPTLETFRGHDGLVLTGWLYRAANAGPEAPAMLSLHGGPEAQERPGFAAQHQTMAAAGITVFAPNIRGSSGFGRAFVHADDRERRRDAFTDVLAARDAMVRWGLAHPERIAVTGRSYGGYVSAAMLAFHPREFAAGVVICGMTDLLTFYRDTEPWIGQAAKSKYGDPDHDRALLADLSPMRSVDEIVAPVLVVHGELDTNVPVGEAHQFVDALRGRDHDVEYLELAGEGHVYRSRDARSRLTIALRDFLLSRL